MPGRSIKRMKRLRAHAAPVHGRAGRQGAVFHHDGCTSGMKDTAWGGEGMACFAGMRARRAGRGDCRSAPGAAGLGSAYAFCASQKASHLARRSSGESEPLSIFCRSASAKVLNSPQPAEDCGATALAQMAVSADI